MFEHTILRDITCATAINTAVFLSLQNAAERLRDQVAFEGFEFGSSGGRVASGDGESVNELENEESRESTAEVADAMKRLAELFWRSNNKSQTYVARSVM